MNGRRTLPLSNAVFFLGQTGTGKSFLANILLGNDAFESKFSVTGKPITKQIQIETATIGDKTTQIIDGPGLYESNPTECIKNAGMLKNALIECEGASVRFIYVMTLKGGRLGIEDTVNFETIMSAYPYTAKNFVFVVNQCPEAKLAPATLKKIFERFDNACPKFGLETAVYTSFQMFQKDKEITALERTTIKNQLEKCLKKVPGITIDKTLVTDLRLSRYCDTRSNDASFARTQTMFADKTKKVAREIPSATTIKIEEENANSCTLL